MNRGEEGKMKNEVGKIQGTTKSPRNRTRSDIDLTGRRFTGGPNERVTK